MAQGGDVPKVHLTLSVTDMPGVIDGMRAAVAAIIRDVADDEDVRTARRLREIADAFQKDGLPPDGYK